MNADRDQTKKRLILILEQLAKYCKPQDSIWPGTVWPSREFLQSLENHVMLRIATQRKKPPSPIWNAFQLLNRRMPSLRLVLRVNNLVKRARDRLAQAGESALEKLARQDREDAQGLVRDIGRLEERLSNAKAIDWTQHENVLKRVSGSGGLQLSCGDSPASPKVTCYTRALEILLEDYWRKPFRNKSRPLIEWAGRIGHPEAKSLCAFDEVAAWIVEQEGDWRGKSALQKREKGRERTRRHREWYRGSWVYPGDWLRFRDVTHFTKFWGRKQAMPAKCSGLEDSEVSDRILKYDPIKTDLSCGRRLSDGFYYHRTRHVARCHDCQEAEWRAQGFDVVAGYPFGDWKVTTAERLAEQKRLRLEQLERDRRWLQTPDGRQWLSEANRRFKELQRQSK